MTCIICNNFVKSIFSKKILGKYDCEYFQCEACGFLQTEAPYWLDEAYSTAIASTDIGYVNRNIKLARKLEGIILQYFDYYGRFLDYAGGYGLFVRIMRDKGFDFYWQDTYCQNIFAQYFENNNFDLSERRFELVTGFELLEHLADPYRTLNEIFKYSDSFLFSTLLQPQKLEQSWWYLVQETGQHVSFYTLESLNIIASKYECHLYSNRKGLHLLSRKKMMKNPFEEKQPSSLFSKFRRKKIKKPEIKSLLQQDYEYVQSIFQRVSR